MRNIRPARPAAVVAIGLAAGSAFAQESETQIYGTFNVDVESVSATHIPARARVTQNSSNIGFRGTERLSPDLTTFWQVESGVPVDAGNGTLASRNSAVGLRSRWGTLFLGQWDTPYKSISGSVDPMYFTGITYTGALIGTPGFGVGPTTIGQPALSGDGRTFRAGANASFERRQGNSIQYWSPAFGGLTGRLAYSVNEGRTQAAGLTQVNPYILSGSLEYQAGILYLGYASESHADYFGLSSIAPAPEAIPVAASGANTRVESRDRGDKLIARVKVGGTQIGVMAERLRYTLASHPVFASAMSKYRRDAIVATLVQRVGASGTVRALAGRASAGHCERFDGGDCDTHGLGAKQYSLGYSYTASRRTDLYAFYTRVSNDERATYQFANGAGLGAVAGSASVGYVLGIRHTF